MKHLLQWKNEVASIQSYLDEDYTIDNYNIGGVQTFKDLQLPWGRMIVDKFVDRLNLVISGGLMTKAAEEEIIEWITQAVEFGNASLIVTDEGRIRIPAPSRALAQKQNNGRILFLEDLGDDGTLWGIDDELYYRAPATEIDVLVDNAQIFTIFYGDSNEQPYGQSRLSRAIRKQITWASKVLSYIESVSFNQSHTQLIFTGINQEIMQAYQSGDVESAESLKAIQLGIHKALMVGEGDKTEPKVSTVDPTDPSGLIKVFERIVANVATSRNMEPREFGNIAAVAPSAEAQHSQDGKLISEVNRFIRKITRPVLSALVAVAEANGEPTPTIFWDDPAMLSATARMAAFNMKVQAMPATRLNKVSLVRAGFTTEEIEEFERMGTIGEVPSLGGQAAIETLEVIEDATE